MPTVAFEYFDSVMLRVSECLPLLVAVGFIFLTTSAELLGFILLTSSGEHFGEY